MPVLSRVIVVSSEARVVDAVRFGFERAGASVAALPMADALSARLVEEPAAGRATWPELVVAGVDTVEHAGALLGALRQAMRGKQREVPILCLGPSDLTRAAALEAGASELLLAPAFVRDTVTLGQLLVTAARANRRHSVEGHLSDYGGVFFLARAMAAVGRTAVLSLVRGLRRGELRFYRGQITSAQVGMLHGMAALHQLLLWTRAHFELRDEDVVPRRQIPLSTEEILADAERFLHEMRSVMGGLAPAEVYELVPEQIERGTASIPAPVYRLVQLIDGYRTLADVIEESPYRVFETVRLANRLAELGWIRPGRGDEPTTTPLVGTLRKPAGLSVEHMLANELMEVSGASIGVVELESIPGAARGAAAEATVVARASEVAAGDGARGGAAGGAPGDHDRASGGAGARPGGEEASDGGAAGGAVRDGDAGAAPVAQSAEEPIDWSDVLPGEMSVGFSPVVPSTEAAGEIVSRDAPAVSAPDAVSTEIGLRSRVPAAGERPASEARAKSSSGERSRAGAAPAASAGSAGSAASAGGASASAVDAAADGDLELAPPLVPPAPVKPRKSLAASLWKRLFGRGSVATDDDGGLPRPGGKRGRSRSSRRRR
jgi:hypothetical protein